MTKSGDKRSRKKAALRLRRAVLETALATSRSGLSPGRSGNVSCRHGEGMLITPSGMPYAEIDADDIVFVCEDGTPEAGALQPSSEWRFHLAAYAARPDRHAVVHCHSMHATVLACAGRPIPAFHYMVALAGGNDIPLVPYATFGTAALAEQVARGLTHRDACLMAHHGQIAIGRDLGAALELAEEVEVLAESYVKLLTLGTPELLPDEEMAAMVEKFRGYGQNAQRRR